MFFDNEQELLNLDELVLKNESFKRIMADEKVTDKELYEQARKTLNLLREVDTALNSNQKQLVKELLSELSVLFTIHNLKQIDKLNEGL